MKKEQSISKPIEQWIQSSDKKSESCFISDERAYEIFESLKVNRDRLGVLINEANESRRASKELLDFYLSPYDFVLHMAKGLTLTDREMVFLTGELVAEFFIDVLANFPRWFVEQINANNDAVAKQTADRLGITLDEFKKGGTVINMK